MRKKQKPEEDSEEEYEPRVNIQGYHVALFCGLVCLALGLYLTFTNSTTTGHSVGRGGIGGPVTLNGPAALLLSTVFLLPWAAWAIKRRLKGKR